MTTYSIATRKVARVARWRADTTGLSHLGRQFVRWNGGWIRHPGNGMHKVLGRIGGGTVGGYDTWLEWLSPHVGRMSSDESGGHDASAYTSGKGSGRKGGKGCGWIRPLVRTPLSQQQLTPSRVTPSKEDGKRSEGRGGGFVPTGATPRAPASLRRKLRVMPCGPARHGSRVGTEVTSATSRVCGRIRQMRNGPVSGLWSQVRRSAGGNNRGRSRT